MTNTSSSNRILYDPAIHRQNFIKILDNFRVGLQSDKIRDVLGSEELATLRTQERQIREHLDADFRLVVLGSLKRGKSTLINALLGKAIVPTDVVPETVTLNEIRYGPELQIIAHIRDGRRVRLNFEELKHDKLVPVLSSVQVTGLLKQYNLENIAALLSEGFDAKKLARFCMFNPEFQPLCKDLPDTASINQTVDLLLKYAVKKKLLEPLLAWVETENPTQYRRHQPYWDKVEPTAKQDYERVTSISIDEQIEQIADTVSHLDIRIPADWLQGICLVDTPGMEDIRSNFEQQIQAFLPKSDAVLYVVTAITQLSDTEAKFLKNAILPRDFPKIFFVINQVDKISPKDRSRVIRSVRAKLDPLFPEANIFALSALNQLERQLSLQNKPDQDMELVEAFETFRVGLEESILLNRDLIQTDRAVTQTIQLLDEFENYVRNLQVGMNTDTQTIAERIAQCENENSELNQSLQQHKQTVQETIAVLHQQAQSWLGSFINRLEQETIPSIGNHKYEDVKQHFHLFLTESIQSALNDCLEVQCPLIMESLNNTHEAIFTDIQRLVELPASEQTIAKSVAEVTFGDFSWLRINMFDNLASNMAGSLLSLNTFFTTKFDVIFSATGTLLTKRRKSKQAAKQLSRYQQSLQTALPQLRQTIGESLRMLYDELATEVEQQLEQSYQQRLENLLVTMRQVQALHAVKKEQIGSINEVFDEVLMLSTTSRSSLRSIKQKLWPHEALDVSSWLD